MNKLFKQTLCITICVVMVGNTACTSMQAINASKEATTAHNVKVGDNVTLFFNTKASEEIRVTAIGETDITGTREDGTVVVAAYDDLYRIEYEEVEVLKPIGKAVGAVALVALAVIFFALAAGEGY